MKKALVPALLLVLGSVVLGATVFRAPLATAAGGIPSMFVLRGNFVVASFVGPSGGDESPVVLALSRPVAFDRIQCFGAGGASVFWVGNEP